MWRRGQDVKSGMCSASNHGWGPGAHLRAPGGVQWQSPWRGPGGGATRTLKFQHLWVPLEISPLSYYLEADELVLNHNIALGWPKQSLWVDLYLMGIKICNLIPKKLLQTHINIKNKTKLNTLAAAKRGPLPIRKFCIWQALNTQFHSFFGQKSTTKTVTFSSFCQLFFSNIISAPPKVAHGARAPSCPPLAMPLCMWINRQQGYTHKLVVYISLKPLSQGRQI